MNVIYAQEEFPKQIIKSIFLAGPTFRFNDEDIMSDMKSWRVDAIKILEELGYDGTVFVPEPLNKDLFELYERQTDWEHRALKKADCIVFWIPRSEELPGFTTNIEFGMFYRTGKIIVGFPQNAPHTRYIANLAKKEDIELYHSLEDILKGAIDFVGDGALRVDGETDIPLKIWSTKEFQSWYIDLVHSGNKLLEAEQKFVHFAGGALFSSIMHVKIFIKREDRIKSNEFVMFRKNISSVILYRRADTVENYEIVLIKEFRSPVSNKREYVFELPGGSSFSNKNDIEIIRDEIKEETSLDILTERIEYIEEKQLLSTLSAMKCSLYAVELTETEIDKLVNLEKKKIILGVERDTERIYLRVMKLKDVIKLGMLDYSNLGMLMDFFYRDKRS